MWSALDLYFLSMRQFIIQNMAFLKQLQFDLYEELKVKFSIVVTRFYFKHWYVLFRQIKIAIQECYLKSLFDGSF